MHPRVDRTRVAILKALQTIEGAAGASRINAQLATMGLSLQPRTVRFYLKQLDDEGLTRFVTRRRGREITDKGRDEIARANVYEKVGFVAAQVDTLGYRMSFSIRSGSGTIVMNQAELAAEDLPRAMKEMDPVFRRCAAMGQRIALIRGAGTVSSIPPAPPGCVGICTVCSITVNGVLLKEGIPVTSRFGGLVEMRSGRPQRFVHLIEYRGTTVDPLEAFILAGMTRVRDFARTGTGIIGASFREFPSAAIVDMQRISREMEKLGIGGILLIGVPNQPLLDIPVSEGRTGMIVIGGLNPIAAVHEAGIRVTMRSLAGLIDMSAFSPFSASMRR